MIAVRERERTVRISKQRGILKSLVTKTFKSDPRAGALILNLVCRLIGFDATDAEANQPMNDNEIEILELLEQRLLSQANSSKL
jgi:hypothetical protein